MASTLGFKTQRAPNLIHSFLKPLPVVQAFLLLVHPFPTDRQMPIVRHPFFEISVFFLEYVLVTPPQSFGGSSKEPNKIGFLYLSKQYNATSAKLRLTEGFTNVKCFQ